MAVMRIVPNPDEIPYGGLGTQSLPSHVGPARLPSEPNFGPRPAGPPQPVQAPHTMAGPIYPSPGWHVGPAVANYGSYGEAGSDRDFTKMVKFGVIDNGLLILMTALGVGMDEFIAEKLRVPKGWGPIMGASIGNAISDGAAGFSDGPKAALGVTLGALLPVIPVFIASSVMKAKPTDKKAQYIMMGSSAALVLWAYLKK